MNNTNENNSKNGTRPAAPPEMNCDSDSENCEMPEPPEGFDGEMPSDMGQGGPGEMGEMGGFPGQQASATASDSVLHPVAYLTIGAGSVILGILVSYACFSKFFHLKPGQTFSSLAKFIWFIVVAVVIAAGLIALGYFVPIWAR